MYKTQARNQYAITYSASLTTTLAAPYRLGELLKRANVLNQSNSDETGSDQGHGIAHEAHTCPKSSTSTRTRNQNENAVFFLLKKIIRGGYSSRVQYFQSKTVQARPL